MQGEQHVALPHRVPGLGVHLDAGSRLHRVLLAGPTGAQAPSGDAHGVRVETRQHAGGAGAHLVPLRGDRQRGVGVTALGRDHPAPHVHGPTVGQRGGDVLAPAPGGVQHLLGEAHGELDDVGGTAAGEHLDRLTHLEGVAGGEAERVDMSVRSATVLTPASVPRSTIVRASSVASSRVFMKAPLPTLTSSTSAPGALGDLLAHDRGGDERDRLDGAGDVAQRVELLVGGGQPEPAAQMTAPTSSSWRIIASLVRTLPAGDRLELVEGAAGVAEAAAGELRHRDAEDGDEGASGRVILSPTPPVECLSAVGRESDGEVHPLAAGDHRRGPGRDLAAGHPVEQHRHREGAHLLVGDDAARCRRR